MRNKGFVLIVVLIILQLMILLSWTMLEFSLQGYQLSLLSCQIHHCKIVEKYRR